MPNNLRYRAALLASAWLINGGYAPAVAQNQFRDPGPPPVGAAPVPTLSQTGAFIEKYVKQNGVASCSFLIDGDNNNQSKTVEMNLNDNGAKVRYVQQQTMSGELGTYQDSNTKEYSFSMSDIGRVAVQSAYVGRRPQCDIPFEIVLYCTSGECVNVTITSLQKAYDKPASNLRDSVKAGTVTIPVNDKDVGDRLVKALDFYRSEVKQVAPEPF